MAVFSGNGSAAAPSFTFSSDTNLGIYRGGTDIISFTTAGSERSRIDASGNLEIGGTLGSAPNISLNADGSGEFADEVISGDATRAGTYAVMQPNGYIEVVPASDSDTGFRAFSRDQSTPTYIVKGDGSVSIGGQVLTSPNTVLNADGSATFASQQFRIGTSGETIIDSSAVVATSEVLSLRTAFNSGNRTSEFYADGSLAIGGTLPASPNIVLNADGLISTVGQVRGGTNAFSNPANTDLYGCQFTSNGDSTGANATIFARNYNSAGRLFFGANSGGSEVFRVESDGTIRLYGNAPAYDNTITLSPDGTSRFASDMFILDGTFNINPGSQAASVYFDRQGRWANNVTATGLNDNIGNNSPSGGGMQVQLEGAGANGGIIKFSSYPVTAAVNTPITLLERMRLDSDGALKIGGTLPSSPNISLNADGLIDFPVGYIDFRSFGSDCDINASGDNLVLRSGSNGVQLLPNATAWTTYTSESRLKNILGDVDAEQAWDLVKNIELKRYQYKSEDIQDVSYAGPMADWLGIQDPELLIDTGRSDEEGPIHTFNQGLLDVKAMQALSTALTRIEELEARLDAAGV